jgi:small subunit ribosomal protein S15
MPLTKEKKQAIVKKYGKNETDSGDIGVQIAILTQQINELTEHVKKQTKDVHSRMGLLKQVEKRKKLLNYLKNNDIEKYRTIIKELNIRK